MAAMECVIVHDLFLNETANYAHVFLPGSTFLEKDGTFTNAERRIQLVRKVMEPANGMGDWEVTQALANAMGLQWRYTHLHCYPTLDRSGLEFSAWPGTGGLVSPVGFASMIGGIFPIALCGRSSL